MAIVLMQFHAGSCRLMQMGGRHNTFVEGHSSAEHAAVIVYENWVAEAAGPGLIINPLATEDRATTYSIDYRCRNRVSAHHNHS